jgi:cytochrome P450
MIVFNPYGMEFAADPYPLYARLREEAPVYHNAEMNFWALSRFDDVYEGHRDANLYSSAGGVTIEGAEAVMPLLIVKDPPEHNWAKGLVTKIFSKARMTALDVFIRNRTVELLEAAYEKYGADGEFDLVSEFSVRLPLDVISELLSIPVEFREEIHDLSNKVISRDPNQDPAVRGHATMRSLQIYNTLAQERRANMSDDVISMLIEQEVKDDKGNVHRMDDNEIAIRFFEMGFAGHETVAKGIPNGAMAFAKFPSEQQKLNADRGLLPGAVDEILRYDPPSQLQGRTTTRDVTLHGVTIPAKSKVMLLTGAATRDPSAFENPDVFDISRTPDPRSIFFGFGQHKCLGQHLARQEISTAFDELRSRFPNYEVDPSRVTRGISSNVRGVNTLPTRLGAHA